MIHPIDQYVGNRIRFKRKAMHLTQSDLAKKLNLTFQQIQKYEKGDNRVSASKLFEISIILEEPVSYFYEGYNPNVKCKLINDITESSIRLLDLFNEISDKKVRKHIINIVQDYGVLQTKLRKKIEETEI